MALGMMAIFVSQAEAGFFGPSTELLSPEKVLGRLQEQPFSFSTSGGQLLIRTKAAAIGGFILGTVLSSAGASTSVGNVSPVQMQQQMQANMAIAQNASVQIQGVVRDVAAKEARRSVQDMAKQGPLPLLARDISQYLQTQKARLAGQEEAAKPELTLSLQQPEWKLEFSMLSSDYTLSSNLHLVLLDIKADKVYLREDCKVEYAKKMPLESWEQDEYKAIAQAAEDIARQCWSNLALTLGAAVNKPDRKVTPVLADASMTQDGTVTREETAAAPESGSGAPVVSKE